MIKQMQDKLNSADSYISMALGLAVVLVIGTLAYNFATKRPQPQSEQAKQTEQKQEQKTHTVAEGETLWGLAETYYKDGFKWKQIADANNLTNGVTVGQTLVIPQTPEQQGDISAASTDIPVDNLTPTPTLAEKLGSTGPTGATPTQTNTPQPTPESTKAQVQPTATPAPSPAQVAQAGTKTYTVVAGDNLWDLAVKQYNDGYKWVEIARTNKLANPNIIHPGNVLTMP